MFKKLYYFICDIAENSLNPCNSINFRKSLGVDANTYKMFHVHDVYLGMHTAYKHFFKTKFLIMLCWLMKIHFNIYENWFYGEQGQESISYTRIQACD